MTWRTVVCGVAAILVIAACGASGTGPIRSGLFTLVSVDGMPLPFRDITKVTVRGSLDLPENHKFTLSQTDSTIAGGALAEFHANGDWTVTENAISLTGGPGVGLLFLGISYGAIDSVRLTFGPHVNVYVRK